MSSKKVVSEGMKVFKIIRKNIPPPTKIIKGQGYKRRYHEDYSDYYDEEE